MTSGQQTVAQVNTPWLSAPEAAAYLRVSKRRLYRLIALGKLRAVRVNGRREVRCRREWLDEAIESFAD